MIHFTKSQIEEIGRQLALHGVRDTDLETANALNGEEYIAIVQGGENRKVKVNQLYNEDLIREILETIARGESAYEIAVRNGFVGTEEEWLRSLSGMAGAATTNDLGGIKIGFPADGKNYPVQLDGSNRAYVYVPWESGGTTPTPTPTPTRSGGYYELIFTAVASGTTPTKPVNQSTDSQLGIWSHSVDMSENGKVIWMADRFVGDTVGDWMGPWIISGANGLDGLDGDKVEFIFALTTDPDTDPSDPTSSNSDASSPVTDKKADGFIPSGWSNHPSGITSENRAEWMSMRFKVFSASKPNGEWTAFSAASLWSVYGKDGRDGDGVEYIFYAGTELPETLPSSWSITGTGFQDPDYYVSPWTDNPVDLEDESYGQGTKQWVCTRKKYADPTSHATYGTNPYWHAFSSPSLWTYYAQDGDAGIGVVADLLPDSFAVPLLEGGTNKSYTATTTAKMYNGAASVSNVTATVTSVTGSDNNSYASQGWITASGDTITVSIPADTINLSSITLRAVITVSATLPGDTDPTTRQAILSIIGINFGTDGVSYTLDAGYPVIRKKRDATAGDNATRVPNKLQPVLLEVTGSHNLNRYTADTLAGASSPLPGFFIYYQIDDAATWTKLENQELAVSSASTLVQLFLIYVHDNIESLVLRENIHVIEDAEKGGHYEQAFRTYSETTPPVPAAPSTYPLPTNGAWQKSAPNDGPVWMTVCWVNGAGQMVGSWETPWCISGTDGNNGIDGRDYEYIYTVTNSTDSSSVPDPASLTGTWIENGERTEEGTVTSQAHIDDFVPHGWTDDPSGINATTGKYEWVSQRFKKGSRNGVGGEWSAFSEPRIWSAWGQNGTDGSGVEYIYYVGTTPPTYDPNSWLDTTADFQNTKEYIASGTGWVDDPVDLSNYPSGTKQWVSIRKKYYDANDLSIWGPVRWHKYSTPKLWSSVGKDAVINGIYADFDNDMLAVGLDSNDMNFALIRDIQCYVNYAGEPISQSDITITDVTIHDTTAISYDTEGWVTADDEDAAIHINIPAGSVNMSQVNLEIQVNFSASVTVGGSTTTMTTSGVIQIIGVKFGEDGASYDMITNTRTIWLRDGETQRLPAEVSISITKFVGLDTITSYTIPQLREIDGNFTFQYKKDEDTVEWQELNNTSVISTNNVDSYLIVKMFYKTYLVDQETIYVGRDGTDGKSNIRLDLDNENDSMLYDRDGNLLSGNVTSIPTLYDGYDDVSSQASSWSFAARNCSITSTPGDRTVTVTGISSGSTAASVEVSCEYKGKTYRTILTLKKIVGDAKYDLRITPKDAIFYNTTTLDVSSSTIQVEIWRTAANGNGGVTKAKCTSLPAYHTLSVDNTAVSYNDGYTINVSQADLTSKVKYIISLHDTRDSSLVDQETVYIARYANGADGANGTQAVCPFRGEYDPDKFYYGSVNRTDIVQGSDGKYYIAKPGLSDSPFKGIDPVDDVNHTHWKDFEGEYESLATGFLFAKDIVTTHLETVDDNGRGIVINNNVFGAYDSNGAKRVDISGDSIPVGESVISYNTTGTHDSGFIFPATTYSAHNVGKDFTIANFYVPSTGISVDFPALSIKAAVSKGGYTTPYAATLKIVVLSMPSKTEVKVLRAASVLPVDGLYHTYTTEAITGDTTLSAGSYSIVASLTWNVPNGLRIDKAVAGYGFTDETTGSVLVGNPNQQQVSLGKNGLSIHLGGGFKAVFAVNPDTGTPYIALEGKTSSTATLPNKTFGIKISSSSNEVQIKRPGDDGYFDFTALVESIVRAM